VISKAAKPFEGRIHFGRDSDPAHAAIQRARPVRATTAARREAASGGH
jgi:hypothetical protein